VTCGSVDQWLASFAKDEISQRFGKPVAELVDERMGVWGLEQR
jgi:hypothetical protein